MRVALHFFKPSGKWYSCGEYDTQRQWMFEVVGEVATMMKEKSLPGLMGGHSEFDVLISIPEGFHLLRAARSS